MAAIIEALLALFGLVVLGIGFYAWIALSGQSSEDSGDPYRDGLDAAARISSMAWETEQLLHHTAEDAKRDE